MSKTYTVRDLESDTGLKGASLRVALRESPFERNGRSWEWSSKAEYDKVVAHMKERASRRPGANKAESKTKPKTASKKAATKKAASKKATTKTPRRSTQTPG